MNNHILIIDDDNQLTDLIKKFLENHQYKVSVSNSPLSGFKLFQKKNVFDLIVLDITMPDMDGFKLLEQVGLEMDLPVISKLLSLPFHWFLFWCCSLTKYRLIMLNVAVVYTS